ncbi:MAG: biotin/lipoyl-containing protein, partial [Ilumatobacteraceae bacterium]
MTSAANDADRPVDVTSHLQGTVVTWDQPVGSSVRAGDVLGLIESMKLHHEVRSPVDGVVVELLVDIGSTLSQGTVLARVAAGSVDPAAPADDGDTVAATGTDRADLAEVMERHRIGSDDARPEMVASRHGKGRRTARENVTDLIDEGSLIEYGPLVVAAQRRRRELADLVERTPADGLVAGLASVNGDLFPGRDSRCVVMSYDYSVLAGTQGHQNHRKKDRLFELAEQLRVPVVFFTEGGGGRPGDTDTGGVTGLDCLAFLWWAQLSGTVPLVGINSGYCFAGNAAILG